MKEVLSPDLILTNGHVICMDRGNTIAEAVAVKDKKIIAVGSSTDIRSLAGTKTEAIDLKGRSVIPGMIDSHTHQEWWGRDKATTSFRDEGCQTVAEAIALLKKKVTQTKPGEWVSAHGVTKGMVAHGSLGFSLKEVDAFSANNPIFIDPTPVGHFFWINSYALRLYNITKETQPEEIRSGIARDANGEPTGELGGDAWLWVLRNIKPYTFEDYLKALRIATDGFLALGITTAHECLGDPYILKGWRTLEEQGKLNMRIFITPSMERYSDLYIKSGIRTGFGSDMLRLHQFKIILNTLEDRTAALLEDYADDPGNRGSLLWPPEQVEEWVMNSVKNGWSVHTHVSGDRDEDMMLTAYEKALEWYKQETGGDNADLRLTLCHYRLWNEDILKRTKALKIVVNTSPVFRLERGMPGGVYEQRLGHERWKRVAPVKTLFDAGINPCFGADYPAAADIDPRKAIYACLDGCGQPWEIISPYQALQGFTINGAYALLSEDRLGSIEVSKFADLVVLSGNPLTMPKESIWDVANNSPKDLLVDYTIVNGKIEYVRS